MDPEGVVHRNKPLRLGGGGVPGGRWWQPELPGRKWGEATPPSEKGVKMFELAQHNLFTQEVKKGGGEALAIHRHVPAGAGTWGDAVCAEDLDLDADVVGDHGDGGV